MAFLEGAIGFLTGIGAAVINITTQGFKAAAAIIASIVAFIKTSRASTIDTSGNEEEDSEAYYREQLAAGGNVAYVDESDDT